MAKTAKTTKIAKMAKMTKNVIFAKIAKITKMTKNKHFRQNCNFCQNVKSTLVVRKILKNAPKSARKCTLEILTQKS